MRLELEHTIKRTKPLCLLDNGRMIVSRKNKIGIYDFQTKSIAHVLDLPIGQPK